LWFRVSLCQNIGPNNFYLGLTFTEFCGISTIRSDCHCDMFVTWLFMYILMTPRDPLHPHDPPTPPLFTSTILVASCSRLEVVKEGLLTMPVIHSQRDRHDSFTDDNYTVVRLPLSRPFACVVAVQWLDHLPSILRMCRWVCGRLWSDCSLTSELDVQLCRLDQMSRCPSLRPSLPYYR